MKLDAETLKQMIKEEFDLQTEIAVRPRSAEDHKMIYQAIEKRLSNLKQSMVGEVDELSDSLADELGHHWNIDVSPEDLQRKIFQRLGRYFTGLSMER